MHQLAQRTVCHERQAIGFSGSLTRFTREERMNDTGVIPY